MKRKRDYLLYVLVFSSLILFSCVGSKPSNYSFFVPTSALSSKEVKNIRVSIKQINVWDSDYYLWNSFLHGKKSKQLNWKDAKELSPRQLFFLKDGFSLDGKKYKGKLILEKDYKKVLRLINEIDTEDYLKSVLPSEMIYSWPIEALKAQAVVSRTYASYDLLNSVGFLESSVLDQVYGGKTVRRPATDLAVDKTKGQILTYEGKIFPAYFHSASGGLTTTIPHVWSKQKNFKVIESVKDKYSKKSPHQNWKTTLSQSTVSSLLAEKGHRLGTITSLQILKKDPTGRVLKIKVKGTRGSKTFTGNDFRLMLGWKNLKSTFFEVTSEKGKFVFEGHGFGHGVGFSQWGAKVMADEGATYREILKFYFPKAELRK